MKIAIKVKIKQRFAEIFILFNTNHQPQNYFSSHPMFPTEKIKVNTISPLAAQND